MQIEHLVKLNRACCAVEVRALRQAFLICKLSGKGFLKCFIKGLRLSRAYRRKRLYKVSWIAK